MPSEFHTCITFSGDAEARKRIVLAVLAETPQNWEWYRIVFNRYAPRGKDRGNTTLDFYSTRFPCGVVELSERFENVEFRCEFVNLDGQIDYVVYCGGVELQRSVEYFDIQEVEELPSWPMADNTYEA